MWQYFDKSLQEKGNEMTGSVLVNIESKQSTNSFPEYKQGKENVASDPMSHLTLSLQEVHGIVQQL